MRTLFYLVLAASIATQVHGRLDPNRPEAKPNRELSTIESVKRTTFDFFSESLGIQAVSESNELFIRNVINELDMNDYCIEIRKMSNFAQLMFGRTNAFVMPSLSKKTHAFLYISEEWFDTLSVESKEALIKHELMHIKHNHVGKKLLAAGVLGSALLYLAIKIDEEAFELMLQDPDESSAAYKTFIQYSPFILLASYFSLTSAYSRTTEKEADIKAAETMADKTGFVNLFKDIKAETEDPESKFAIKRFIAWALKPLGYLNHVVFASHPDLDDRIEYIQDLA